MKNLSAVLLLASMFFPDTGAQSLFESGTTDAPSFHINGYGRGVMYLGEQDRSGIPDLKSGYGELSLQLSGNISHSAAFFTDVRFRSGHEYNSALNDLQLREAYVAVYPSRFEFRIGQQVVSWGRADGFNPTNNLTPQNYFVRSPRADDMNMGNFLVSGTLNLSPELRVEAVWAPMYRYSIYRFDLFDMPEIVSFNQSTVPDGRLKNSSLAGRIEFLFSRFDGSLSWFSGYDPMPGIEAILPAQPSAEFSLALYSRAFRQQTFGTDLAFSAGLFSIRTEAGYRIPSDEDKNAMWAADRDLRFAAGVDRSFGNTGILLQYMGQYVFDYQEMPDVIAMADFDPAMDQDPAMWQTVTKMMMVQLHGFNQIIHRQTEEMSHALMLRPSVSLLYETLSIEVTGLAYLTTEEWSLMPVVTYRLNDNLQVSAGGQYFDGPDQTAYELVAPVFNSVFAAMKYSF